MLATVIDQINQLTYGLGGAQGEKPKPLQRPWGRPGTSTEEKVYKGRVMPIEELDAWLADIEAATPPPTTPA